MNRTEFESGIVSKASIIENECIGKILDLLKENEKGITEKTLQIAMSNVDNKIRAKCINDLLAKSKIEILKQGNQLLYKLKVGDRKLYENDEENVVYSIIEDAGNKGIWSRDIRFKSKLPLTLLNKVLKSMENKKLIKSVRSVAAYKKKVYMLYDVKPDISVTGGTWYSNNDFESEFVEVLNQQCYRYLQKRAKTASSILNPNEKREKSYASSSEMCEYIRMIGISKVELNVPDIECILETLIYDGKVDKYIIEDGEDVIKMYRAIEPFFTTTGLMRMPCGLCTVRDECTKDGLISPSKCVYFKEWFDY